MLTAYKRIHWFNSDFHSGFLLNDNQKITEISFDVNPFQIDVNNNLKVVTYVRDSTQSKPIQIKLKEPYNQSREVFNDDNEAFPIIYINHTGTEGMNTYYPYSIARLIPQQIPRFIFRVDDNYGLFLGNNYFTSITNGETLPVIKGSPNEKFIIFKSSGSFTLTDKMVVDILVVGGGGGGGSGHGGGGGAGAVIYKTNYNLSSGSYTVTIGAGGAGGAGGGSAGDGTNGGDTIITNGALTIFRAKGGGKGVRVGSGGVGGSGGGAGGSGGGVSSISNDNIPQDTDVFGFAGGSSTGSYIDSGGGGGAGGVGANGSGNNAGNGGSGKQISIIGTPVFYADGGGGGGSTPNGIGGTGGAGGGGTGGSAGGNGTSAIANTGSGGGGSGFNDAVPIIGAAGAGGSGVVIIRYTEIRKRIEGITPDETLIQATNTNIPITIDSQYQINYQPPMVLPKGTYESIFNNGAITFKSKPDYSYPNTSNMPIVWYKFDTNNFLIDSSGNGSNLINNGATLDNDNYKRGNGSLSVGNNKYVSFINDIQFRNIQTTNGISISVWFKGSTLGTWSAIFSFGVPYSDGNTKVFTAAKSASTTNLQFFYPRAGNSFVTSGTNYFNNTWYHLIWTITNIGVSTIYINGVNIGATIGQENFADSVDYNTNKFLGRGAASTSEYLDGNIDDFRIYNYVLSPVEVYDLYNGNTDRSYPILKDADNKTIEPRNWYKFDTSTNLGLDDMGIHNLTNPNGVAFSNDYIKGNGSASFDGVNDHLIKDGAFNLNNKSWSVSVWCKKTSNTRSDLLFELGTGYTAYTTLTCGYNLSNNIIFGVYSDDLSSSSTYNDAGIWVHVCFTFLTGTKRGTIYRNGVQVGQKNFSGELNTNNDFRIGKLTTNYFQGLMDDFRIYQQELTATQVAELYNGRLSIYNPPGFILGTEIEPE